MRKLKDDFLGQFGMVKTIKDDHRMLAKKKYYEGTPLEGIGYIGTSQQENIIPPIVTIYEASPLVINEITTVVSTPSYYILDNDVNNWGVVLNFGQKTTASQSFRLEIDFDDLRDNYEIGVLFSTVNQPSKVVTKLEYPTTTDYLVYLENLRNFAREIRVESNGTFKFYISGAEDSYPGALINNSEVKLKSRKLSIHYSASGQAQVNNMFFPIATTNYYFLVYMLKKAEIADIPRFTFYTKFDALSVNEFQTNWLRDNKYKFAINKPDGYSRLECLGIKLTPGFTGRLNFTVTDLVASHPLEKTKISIGVDSFPASRTFPSGTLGTYLSNVLVDSSSLLQISDNAFVSGSVNFTVNTNSITFTSLTETVISPWNPTNTFLFILVQVETLNAVVECEFEETPLLISNGAFKYYIPKFLQSAPGQRLQLPQNCSFDLVVSGVPFTPTLYRFTPTKQVSTDNTEEGITNLSSKSASTYFTGTSSGRSEFVTFRSTVIGINTTYKKSGNNILQFNPSLTVMKRIYHLGDLEKTFFGVSSSQTRLDHSDGSDYTQMTISNYSESIPTPIPVTNFYNSEGVFIDSISKATTGYQVFEMARSLGDTATNPLFINAIHLDLLGTGSANFGVGVFLVTSPLVPVTSGSSNILPFRDQVGYSFTYSSSLAYMRAGSYITLSRVAVSSVYFEFREDKLYMGSGSTLFEIAEGLDRSLEYKLMIGQVSGSFTATRRTALGKPLFV